MTPEAVQIITVLITAVATILASFFARSFGEWRKGKKDEAQKMVKRLESSEREAELYKQEYNYFRAWVLAQGVLSSEQLSRMPRPPGRE